jgi:hypothetical protein
MIGRYQMPAQVEQVVYSRVGVEKTHLGQSIARYDGQKLIIESTHLLPNFVAPNGNLLTGQTTTVGTCYRKDKPDGRAVLALDLVATDPGHLTAPWTISWEKYARRLKKKHQGYGDTFFIDEVFVKIDGKQHYLWRAVDQDGEIVDVFLQRRRDGNAAKRFFERLLKTHRDEPRKIVTNKLRSYGVAHRELIPEAIHDTSR